jgi:leucyl aminopeptidase (aminopeptidase T)
MEQLAIEAQLAGGMVTIFLDSDKVIRSLDVDVPERFLSAKPEYVADFFRAVDVYINLPQTADIKALDAGVSAERLGKLNAASAFLTPLTDTMKYRQLYVTYPTAVRGVSHGVDGPAYVSMLWSAINADYSAIAAKGAALAGILKAAHTVRVTSPEGTDLSVTLGGGPVTVSDGVITAAMAKGKKAVGRSASLPDGTVTAVPAPGSARGKVVVPSAECRVGRTITNIRFSVAGGTAAGLTTGSGGSCLSELIAASGGPTMELSSIQIGLNPAWGPYLKNGAAYYPSPGAGVVYLSIGDNQVYGGSVRTVGTFGFGFPIADATVYADTKKVVDRGKLSF